MIGFGTIINTFAIIIGGIVGLLVGKTLKEGLRKIIIVAMGLSVAAMSLSGIVSKMLVIKDGSVETAGTFTIIISLTLGGIFGEIIDIDKQIERFGTFLKNKTGNAKDSRFIDAFVNASLTVCVGAMAIVGSIMDGISGDYSILATKAILDFVIIIVMTASMGKGCIFSAIPVAVLQGGVTLLAKFIGPLLSDFAINNISMVGSVLILCIGVNLLSDGKFKIKVANLLPAVVFAGICAYIPFLQI